MIRKIKIKFMLLCAVVLFLLLGISVTAMNVINLHSVVEDADEVLTHLLRGYKESLVPEPPADGAMDVPPKNEPRSSLLLAELPYEVRYFWVELNDAGAAIRANIDHIATVDKSEAAAMAESVLRTGETKGFKDRFRFRVVSEGELNCVIFLDCGRSLDSFYTFLLISTLIAFVAYVLVVFIVSMFSGRILRPVLESYEKQKRFITDAGHEIKTPLTIINANVDVLEMDMGTSEPLGDIRQQTQRLITLTHELVSLSRMEEMDRSIPRVKFPISEVVQEAAFSFKGPAQAQSKSVECEIQPMLSAVGDSKAISKLVNILMENALKYSPASGDIWLSLSKQGKSILLVVKNTTIEAVKVENLPYLFDRFYRADVSRNSATGGYGIGLSMAKAIVQAHGGKIWANTGGKYVFCITCSLPAA